MKVKVLDIIDKKTFKAFATSYKKHSRYKKYISVRKEYLVESNGCDLYIGKEVEIKSSRPLSKNKRWVINLK